MKRTFILGIATAVLFACIGAEPVSADEAVEQLITQIVGDSRSNAERAEKLYVAAEVAKDTPEIQAVMLVRAIQYGMKSMASPKARTAVQNSLTLLGKVAPDRADEWRGLDIDLQRRLFRASKSREAKATIGAKLIALQKEQGQSCGAKGDWAGAASAYREAYSVATMLKLPEKAELSRELRTATHRMNVSKKIAQYKTVLKTKPDMVSTRTLLLNALVIDLNSPAQAAEYLNEDVDTAYRTYVPLAAKEASEIQGDVCRELGDWYYKALCPKSAQYSKAAMLVRAQSYYQQFLDAGNAKGVTGVSVKMAIDKIDKELEKMAAAGMPAVKRDRIIFHAKKSMKLFKAGTKQGKFPVQKGLDARTPFVGGGGVYFNQKTGKDVVYEIFSSSSIKSIHYKGAAIFNTHIKAYSAKGKLLATLGPLKGGNSWYEYTLTLPKGYHNHIFLTFRNDASTWFYIDTITLKK